MENFNNILKTTFLAATAVIIASCSKDDPKHIHDHEGIHEVEISVAEVGGTATPTTYDVHAGEMGETISLSVGKTYEITIEALNNDKHENILSEVIAEKDEHFFVYNTTLEGYTFTRIDESATTRTDGKKLGIKVRLTVSAAQSGKQLGIILKHQATAVSDTDNANLGSATGGATDLDVKFGVTVE
ncbi:MAG: hypothetical protein Q4G08_07905 [Capnocytophaga sp.]|nr:hypothetical protein [Capnocytophaga sp.]